MVAPAGATRFIGCRSPLFLVLDEIRATSRTYVASVTTVAVFVLGLTIFDESQGLYWQGLIFFSVLVFLSESFCIDLPKIGAVSITFTIILAETILFGPGLTTISAVFTAVIWRDIKKGTSPIYWLFNGSQYALSAAAASWTYVATGGVILSEINRGFSLTDFPALLGPVTLAVMAFFLTNTLLVSIAIGLTEQVHPFDIWRVNVHWAIPNYFSLAPVALAIAEIFMAAGYIGVVLIFVPLIVARQTFQIYMRLRGTYLGTIQSLIASLEAKDPYTRGHSERVAKLSEIIGRELKLSEEDLETLRYAGILHDIGKVGTARYILRKPGKLTEDERQRIRLHPEAGALILREVSFLNRVVPVIFHHHERYNGTGYIDGIAGEEIPRLARILSVADAYDAMTSPRPYRAMLPKEAACQELIDCSGSHFDPRIVEAFLQAIQYTPDKPKIPEGQLQFYEV